MRGVTEGQSVNPLHTHSSKSFHGILQSITPEVPTVDTLRLEVPFKFKPGQSVQVHFPGEHKKRAYSISSSPTEGPFIEITVKSEPASTLAKAIRDLKIGDPLPVEGPFGGSLTLPASLQNPLAFIAAGTGVTPFRSLLRYLIDEALLPECCLVHSVRSHHDLLFQDEFMAWSGQHTHFRYVPTITRHAAAGWSYETGRITEALLRKHITAEDPIYFLCGPTGFVSDMENVLHSNLGIPHEKIRRERW